MLLLILYLLTYTYTQNKCNPLPLLSFKENKARNSDEKNEKESKHNIGLETGLQLGGVVSLKDKLPFKTNAFEWKTTLGV